MAKGDDYLARKKNKSTRKKMNRKNDTATVSARVASIIAAKKRRKTGKRSMCQGMCFSLPTPEDPYNERQGKPDITKKITKKPKTKDAVREKGSLNKKPSAMSIDNQKPFGEKMKGPTKSLKLFLNKIESSLRRDGLYSEDHHEKSLFINTWGMEFWKCFMSGKDVLETSGTSSTVEQIAWIVSTATDAIARREEDEDESFSNSPFLLYLVPSQSKAAEVRSVCKALKGNGIHTVSVHEGASLDHQIAGLNNCEPEFLISTPERLLEIVNLKGVDISRVSLLVIEELGSHCTGGYLDAVKSIKQAISCKHLSIVFSDSVRGSHFPAVQSLLRRPYRKISLTDSVARQGSSIIKTAPEEKDPEKVLHW